MAPTPVTIITGFLGAGKTTLILNLIPQLPKTYKVCLELLDLMGPGFPDGFQSELDSQVGMTDTCTACSAEK